MRHTSISKCGGTEQTADGRLKQRSTLMKIHRIFHHKMAWPLSPCDSDSFLPTLHCRSNNWLKRSSLNEIEVCHSINEVLCRHNSYSSNIDASVPTCWIQSFCRPRHRRIHLRILSDCPLPYSVHRHHRIALLLQRSWWEFSGASIAFLSSVSDMVCFVLATSIWAGKAVT